MAMDRELQNYLERLEVRLTNIEGTLRRLQQYEGRWNATHAIHPVSAHEAETRGVFLIEILRQKGLLNDIDLEAVTAKVQSLIGGADAPWGVSEKGADRNIEAVVKELKDDYAANGEE